MNQNNYALTRTIRFKLLPSENALAEEINFIKESIKSNELKERNKSLVDNMRLYYERWHDFLYHPKKKPEDNNRLKLIKVNPKWLRLYAKTFLYDQGNKITQGQPLLSDFRGLPDFIKQRLDEWQWLTKQFKGLLERPEHNYARRAEYALLIEQILIADNFPLLHSLSDFAQDKKNEEQKQQLQIIGSCIQTIIQPLRKAYAPAQNSGVEIARASMNYYTINKDSKDYFEGEIDRLNAQRIKQYSPKRLQNDYHLDKLKKIKIKVLQESEIIKELPENLTLEGWYGALKEFLAQQKLAFYESLSKGDLKDQWPLLFKGLSARSSNSKQGGVKDNQVEELLKISEKITRLGTQINNTKLEQREKRNELKQELKQELSKAKKARGYITSSVQNHKDTVAVYKKIAQEYGKLKAQLRGLEKEQLDSQLLNYWSLLAEAEGQHELLLISKTKTKEVYEYLERLPELQEQRETAIMYYKSLTLRALHKLIFSEDSTLKSGIKAQLSNKHPLLKGAYSMSEWKETQVVALYQDVLSLCQTGVFNINVKDFEIEALIKMEYQTIESFRIDLEKACYIERRFINEELYAEIKGIPAIHCFTINNSDLDSKTPNHLGNAHTQLWKSFWSDDNKSQQFPTRLNPEMRIRYRAPKETRVKKYGKGSDNYNSKKRNRYLQEQLTLEVTMTENATGSRDELAFTKPETLKAALEDYNQAFNKKHYSEAMLEKAHFYGIDRGETELASLGMVVMPGQEKMTFPKLTAYTLNDISYSRQYTTPDGEKKTKYAIDNISYFMDEIDNTDIFNKVEVASLDLTCAKLIKGKIITNGDVKSYLKLKMLSAKRRIYEKHSVIPISDDIKIELKEGNSYFRFNTDAENLKRTKIYFYREELSNHIDKEEIGEELNCYLDELRTKNRERDILTIEKINHLRDALASNMVGILSHLIQEKQGTIVLEDLDEQTLNNHFNDKSNTVIGRRLEWRLYNKLAKANLAPPKIRETILLRKDKSIKQFGAVLFVPESGTSQNCPSCQKSPESREAKQHFKKNKFGNDKRYTCEHCGFDTKDNRMGFEGVTNPDDLASYNIAKLGFDYLKKPPEPSQRRPNQRNNNSQSYKTRNTRNNYKNKQRAKPSEATFKAFDGLDGLLSKQDK